MATKWTGTYTPIANVNNGNEFGDGDVITTEMANVPINNAEYAVQVANQAKEKAEQAYNQSKSESIIIYEDSSLMNGVESYQLDSSGLYHVEFVKSVDSLDRVVSGEITFYYDSNRLGDGILKTQYSFSDGTTIIVSCNSGVLELLTQSNIAKNIIKIIKII